MKDFILPDIGEGIVECELLAWLVKEGDTIKEDQPVAEVMTDKATVEIPAMHDGVVTKLYYKEGDIAKVHQPLFAMSQDIETAAPVQHNQQENEIMMSKIGAESHADTNIESFVLPDIGEGIVECEIMEWHIAVGDTVIEDQVVVEVMTDKAVVEIPAKYNGKILKLHYAKGDIAKVHTPLFDQALSDAPTKASTDTAANSEPQHANSNIDHSLPTAATGQTFELESSRKQGETFLPPVAVSRPIASPAVRRLAREKGLSLEGVRASGEKGRILKQDILNTLAGQPSRVASEVNNEHSSLSQSSAKQTNPNFDNQSKVQDRVEAVKGIKAAMAKQMMASVSTIPHFMVSDELCMDNLMRVRTLLKDTFAQQDLKLSFMPFFIKALSLAMLEFPVINSRLNEPATELTYLGSHNIGIAIDSKIGLLVPNIKNVQDLSIMEITRELNRLIEAGRQGKLSNQDLSGGTISISNIGAIGGITATPVINKPDVAIVALGKVQRLPRFDKDDNVQATNIMTVNWSGDHRVIDGATMVRFNNYWISLLSNPEQMLVNLK